MNQEIIDFIWNNKEDFTAVSFLSDYGDKDFKGLYKFSPKFLQVEWKGIGAKGQNYEAFKWPK